MGRMLMIALCGMICLCAGVGRVAFADDPFAFDLKEIARVDGAREPPTFQVVRKRGEKLVLGRNEKEPMGWGWEEKIRLEFANKAVVELGVITHSEEADGTPSTVAECSVLADAVKVGWLADAPDLLLIAWSDDGDFYGTGRYAIRGTIVTRYADKGISPLLSHSTVVSATNRHIRTVGGNRWHYYEYDAKEGTLTDVLSRYLLLEDPIDGDRQPLLHLSKDQGDGDIWYAEISEQVTAKYRYADGRLTLLSTELKYQTQRRGDSVSEIAQFYLGALASENAIFDANPGLKAACKGATVPANTWVRIPVSGKWLAQFYELSMGQE